MSELKNPFNIAEKGNFVINTDYLMKFTLKWEHLSKYQKVLIVRLLRSTLADSMRQMMKKCDFKDNLTAFTKAVLQLNKWGIITVSDFNEKDLFEIPIEIQPMKISKRTKTFRLTENWIEMFLKSDCGANSINSRLKY